MRMPPKGIESIQETPSKGKKSVQEAPPKGIESMQSVSLYDTESHQPLYSEKILTWKLKENWEGFNS